MFVVEVDADGRVRRYLTVLDPAQLESDVRGEAIAGELTTAELDPAGFVPNQLFLRFLGYVIARHATACPGLVAEATRQRDGYVYVTDLRAGTDVGGEDVIGYAEVKNGRIERYVASPNYRAFTAKGFMRLDPWLHARLLDELRALG